MNTEVVEEKSARQGWLLLPPIMCYFESSFSALVVIVVDK